MAQKGKADGSTVPAEVSSIRQPKMADMEASTYRKMFTDQGMGNVVFPFHSGDAFAEFVYPFRSLDKPLVEESGSGQKVLNELRPLCTSISAFLHISFLTNLFHQFSKHRQFCRDVFQQVVTAFALAVSHSTLEQIDAHHRLLSNYSTFMRQNGDPPGFHSLQKEFECYLDGIAVGVIRRAYEHLFRNDASGEANRMAAKEYLMNIRQSELVFCHPDNIFGAGFPLDDRNKTRINGFRVVFAWYIYWDFLW